MFSEACIPQQPCHPRAGLSGGMGSRLRPTWMCRSSHVIPTLASALAWDLWLRRCVVRLSYYGSGGLYYDWLLDAGVTLRCTASLRSVTPTGFREVHEGRRTTGRRCQPLPTKGVMPNELRRGERIRRVTSAALRRTAASRHCKKKAAPIGAAFALLGKTDA